MARPCIVEFVPRSAADGTSVDAAVMRNLVSLAAMTSALLADEHFVVAGVEKLTIALGADGEVSEIGSGADMPVELPNAGIPGWRPVNDRDGAAREAARVYPLFHRALVQHVEARGLDVAAVERAGTAVARRGFRHHGNWPRTARCDGFVARVDWRMTDRLDLELLVIEGDIIEYAFSFHCDAVGDEARDTVLGWLEWPDPAHVRLRNRRDPKASWLADLDRGTIEFTRECAETLAVR